jgi:hypothetical protein
MRQTGREREVCVRGATEEEEQTPGGGEEEKEE